MELFPGFALGLAGFQPEAPAGEMASLAPDLSGRNRSEMP